MKSTEHPDGRLAQPAKPAQIIEALPLQVLHPTQKPVRSLKPVIGTFTRPGEIVLDPFCGRGSTLLAAKVLGRRYAG